MSLYSLGDIAAQRHLAANLPAAHAADVKASPPAPAPERAATDDLVKYIPTESITLYVAGISAISALTTPPDPRYFQVLYITFAVLTPMFLLLIAVGKIRSAGAPFPKPAQWPIWKMTAATIAFLVWALAVPGPLQALGGENMLWAIGAGFGALLVSKILGLLAPIFEQS